jgi:mRNA interferase MazF
MTISDGYDIVTLPFPYVERDTVKRRPALLVARTSQDLGWVLMITSSVNEPWPGDIKIVDLTAAGLRAPSVVRPAKIATVELDLMRRIGSLDAKASAEVRSFLARILSVPGD